jgi:hypothetical protein
MYRSVVTGLLIAFIVATSRRPPAPTFERIYSLQPAEGVFAYARIAPDGKALAYASVTTNSLGPGMTPTVTVVNLPARKVVFREPGIDAYWSNDGLRVIYRSLQPGGVSILHYSDGAITRDVAPSNLGDYFSWSVHQGKPLILTVESNYYTLHGDHAVMPASHVTSCPGIGVGDRPLISHDGSHITTFVRGNVVVRGLTNCENIFDTGLRGAKADFSFNGNYIAFHVEKVGAPQLSDVVVVDLKRHTVRNITASLPGSSLFPSWTEDGRLCFRYDSEDYRGFLVATDVLSVHESPLAAPAETNLPVARTWTDIFPSSPAPSHALTVVMIWGTWSAHTPTALADLQRVRDDFARDGRDVTIATALEPGTWRSDANRILTAVSVHLPEFSLRPEGFANTEARNQIPTELLFRGSHLIDRKLGPMSSEDLRIWVAQAQGQTTTR